MIADNIKDKYLDLLNLVNVKGPSVRYIKEFIETYDGKNEKEFHMMLLSLLKVLIQMDELYTKSEAFDQLVDVKALTDEEIEKISEEFNAIDGGKLPKTPPVASFAQ